MSLASHAGKDTFTINGKTVLKRSGTSNIYDITGGSGGGSGGTKIMSITSLVKWNHTATISDWDPSWRVCVTQMPDHDNAASSAGASYSREDNLFFTERGFSLDPEVSKPLSWSIHYRTPGGSNSSNITLTLNPTTGVISYAGVSSSYTPTITYGVYS